MNHTIFEERYAAHPRDVQHYDAKQLRREFLIEKVFEEDKILLAYSMYDRFIVGGAMPVKDTLPLDSIAPLKSQFFCERREAGIINIGGAGIINVDGKEIILNTREALYIGKGTVNITFKSVSANEPAMFYINSAAAHCGYPTKKITIKEANVLQLGKPEQANVRKLMQYIVAATVQTCQLQMGITELSTGSVWNTMPPHTHNRSMEAYFYMSLPQDQAVCHFMGQPKETRHIWMHNNQAVLSPSWSIHCGVATSSYSFIWSMAGENLDFTDMDTVAITELK